MRDPLWLLDSTPREVQMEALRRSYGGFKLRDNKNDEGEVRHLRDGPVAGGSHYMEMRLGKTPTSINEFELFKRDHGLKRMIAFCPNSFKQGWVDEAEKSASSVPWLVWESDRHRAVMREIAQTGGSFGIAVNYEALKGDNCRAFLEEYVDRDTYLANDESIKIKDPQSIQTHAVLTFAKEAGVVRNLSGLPMTQGPQDMYAQFRAIRMLNGLNFFAYRNSVCKMGGFKQKKVVGVKDPEKLQAWLDQSAFVAKRKDWATPLIPEYYIESLQMTTKQKELYQSMDKDMLVMLESGAEITVDMVVTKLMKLQQISSGFVYNEAGRAEVFEDPRKTPKMMKLMDMMDEAPGKVIVVYNYQESGNALMECLGKWNPAVIRGAEWMYKNDRNTDTEKARFNNDPSCRVIVLQTTSGKYGHDLSGVHGDRCQTMVFYENTYSLDDRTQIEARNTSAFQNWTNTYHDFTCSKVERAAVTALARKEDLITAVFGSYRADA